MVNLVSVYRQRDIAHRSDNYRAASEPPEVVTDRHVYAR
jgi:hypothetical protein